jgi:hypothetical protein
MQDNTEWQNYWYQLTEWQESIGELKLVRKTLEKYHEPYVIKKLGMDRYAVFTMGLNLDDDVREEYLRASCKKKLEVING